MIKILHSKKFLVTLFIILTLGINYYAMTYGSGQGGTYTGAPSESNCTSCHNSFSAQTSGSKFDSIKLDNGLNNTEYIPDSTYTFSISYTESGISKWGFEITVLDSVNKKPAGTLSVNNSSTTQKATNSVGGSTREYIYHKTTSTNGSCNWTFKWKAPSTNVGTVKFYLALVVANGMNGNAGDYVYVKNFSFKPSSLLPTAKISLSKSTICAGDSVTAIDSGMNNPTKWSWSFASASGVSPSTSTDSMPTFTFSNAGLYKIYLTNSNAYGKSLKDSAFVTVNASPTISISANNTTICQGDSVTLYAKYSTGNTILWSTNETTDSIRVGKADSITCTVTNQNGCSSISNKIYITVSPKPTISLASNANLLCSQDTFKLTASPSGNSNYTFIVNGSAMSGSSSNEYILPYSGTSAYNVQVLSDSNGCKSDTSNNVSLTFNTKLAAPTVTCGNSTNSSISINWQSVSNATGYQVSEDSGKTWITPSSGSTGTSHTISGLATNIYYKIYVRATDNAPCNIGEIGDVVCSTGSCNPVGYSLNSYKASVCPNDSSMVEITYTNTGNYSVSLDGGTYTSATQYYLKPTQATTYKFEIIDSAQLSCPTTKFDVNIGVFAGVSNNFNITPNNSNKTWCDGELAKFSVASNLGTNFEFFVNGTSVQNGTQNEYTSTSLKNGDQITVKATNSNGCSGNSSTITATVTPKPVASFKVTQVFSGIKFSFTDTVASNSSFQHEWNFGDGTKGFGASTSHTYTQNGTYTAWLIIKNGNCIDSVSKQVVVQNTGIASTELAQAISIYPNPFTQQLNITWESELNPIMIEMMDMNGAKILTANKSMIYGGSSVVLATESIPSGVYILKLIMENGQLVQKVIKF